MKTIWKMALGLFLAFGAAGLSADPSAAAERVVVVHGRHLHARHLHAHPAHARHLHVRQIAPTQRLGRPLVAAPGAHVLYLTYKPRTYAGVAIVRYPDTGNYVHARRYVHTRKHTRVRGHAHVRKYHHAHSRSARHIACRQTPVVNRFGIVVAFARGC